jgi:hypothetical protein
MIETLKNRTKFLYGYSDAQVMNGGEQSINKRCNQLTPFWLQTWK